MHFSLAKIRTLLLYEKRAPGGRGGRARHFGTKWEQVRFYKRFMHFHTVNRKSLGIERRATLTTEVAHLERRREKVAYWDSAFWWCLPLWSELCTSELVSPYNYYYITFFLFVNKFFKNFFKIYFVKLVDFFVIKHFLKHYYQF